MSAGGQASTGKPGARPRVVVTGAAKRVGLATAEAFARDGCDVVITYRESAAEAGAAVNRLHAEFGCRVELVQLDLSRPDEVERAGAALAAQSLPVDVLVHSASIYGATPLAEITAGEAERYYRVNALGPMLLSKHLAPKLAASAMPGGGAIVAMLDIHALGLPRSGFAAYSMSKAALWEMVRSLARELAPKVRVNGVAPGVVAWPETGLESDEAAQRAYLTKVPLARAGEPADAAEVVRWLALEALYTTGQVIRVDGGRGLL